MCSNAISVHLQKKELTLDPFQNPSGRSNHYTPKLTPVTIHFDRLCVALDIPFDIPSHEKVSTLRAIPGKRLLDTAQSLKLPPSRAVLDSEFISEHVFKHLYSGELARRFHQRSMKLLIGEVEHEEIIYALGAPTETPALLPALEGYYRSDIARALRDYYNRSTLSVEQMFTRIVTDVQVRASSRSLVKILFDGGVQMKDIYRFRISLPINGFYDSLGSPQRERYHGLLPHEFDLLHWWYHASLRSGFDVCRFVKRAPFVENEVKVITEWLTPFAKFIQGEDVDWGTSNIAQFRHLTDDAKIKIVEDPYWTQLMETASVLRDVIEATSEL
jgi:carboxylesterase type B